MRRYPFVISVDLEGGRRYYTGLRDAEGERYLPADLDDPHVLRYPAPQSAGAEVVLLRREGLTAQTLHEFFAGRP